MRYAVRSHHFWICVALGGLFWVTAIAIPNRVLLLLTNSLLLAASTAVGVAYAPVAWAAIRDRDHPRIQHIALGIALSWTFGALWRLWSIGWLMTGAGPEYAYLIQNDLIGFFQSGIALGAFYHLTSPGALGPHRPRARWIAVGAVIGVALGIAAILAYHTPNIYAQTVAEWLKPHIPR